MIYILIGILLVKYRYIITDMVYDSTEEDEVYEILKPGAGIEYQSPKRDRHLRVVK